MIRIWTSIAAVCSLTAALSIAIAPSAHAAEGLGCRPPNPTEQAWMDEHQVIADDVLLNHTAIERINAERRALGRAELASEAAADGNEVVGSTVNMRAAMAARGQAPVVRAAPGPVPTVVDNSSLDAFPPVGDQGSLGTCACFSTTYYTMTYMIARARGVDAKNGGNATRYSPKFCYNFINGGNDLGSWISAAYNVQQNHGAPTLSAWPYDTNFREWPTNAVTWRDAIPSRMGQSGTLPQLNTDTGLTDLKRMLANGYLLNFATNIYAWQFTTLLDDPATFADNDFTGQQVCTWYNNGGGPHAMTVVGYNDNLWADINGNGIVDAGEKGALKIVNNWGTGWGNGGFAWIMYDALKPISAVAGWSGGSDRLGAFWYNDAYWISARPTHQPSVLGEFTINTAKRSQVTARLGLSATSTSTPSSILYTSSLQNAGGAYAIDGGTTAVDATIVLDFTDRLPAGAARCYVNVSDNIAGDPCQITNFKLTDATGTVLVTATSTTPAGGLPKNADTSTVLAWADVSTGDAVAPAKITDLSTTLVESSLITLSWTAPGDDGLSGLATTYDIRYSTSPITNGTWGTAIAATGEPVPQVSGSREVYQLTGLSPATTWYIAMVAVDEVGNTSLISNEVTESTPGVLTISSPTLLPSADVGVAYSTMVTASGGTGARTWSYLTGHRENNPGSSAVAATGTARGWRADTNSWTYDFPAGFAFPFAGVDRTSVRVSSDGYLEFGNSVSAMSGSDNGLKSAAMIAIAWADLTTAGTVQNGEDIYISESADAVTIRWVAETVIHAGPNIGGARLKSRGLKGAGGGGSNGAQPVAMDFQATLRRDGIIDVAWRLESKYAYAGVSDGDNVHWSRSDQGWQLIAPGTRRTWDYLTWPAGLMLDPTTGQVSGLLSQSGIYRLGMQVIDSGYPAQTATSTLTLPVGTPRITSALSATGTVGTPFSFQLTASNTTLSFAATNLPSGLTCTASGLISGEPTTPGMSTVTVTAFNAIGFGSRTMSITINDRVPVIVSAVTATATAGMPFSYQILGNYFPSSFSTSGMPAGLVCSPDGMISGTLSAAGITEFMITATNSAGSDSRMVAITVAPNPAAAAPAANNDESGGGGGKCGVGGVAALFFAAVSLLGLNRRRRHIS